MTEYICKDKSLKSVENNNEIKSNGEYTCQGKQSRRIFRRTYTHADKYPYTFLLLYIFYFGANGVINPFFPIYLDDIGFSQTIKGVLLALGPFVTMLSQPFWGIMGDRAKTKNTILKILIAASAAIFAFFPLLTEMWYVFIMYFMFMFFHSSINPTIDTITLDYLERTRWKFGPIRMGGTISFAVVSVFTGFIIRNNVSKMFIIYSVILFTSLVFIRKLHPIKGYQFGGKKISPAKLLKDKKLMSLMAFGFTVQVTLGYYYSFYPVYFKELGGDSALLGWAMFISAFSEIPFLLFADKIVEKLGIVNTLIGSALVTALRWFATYSANNAHQALLANCMHGLTFIVFTYCLAVFINKNVPKELRASGQALNWLINMGAARILANILGGFLSDVFGIKDMFLYISLLGFVTVIVFYYILKKSKKYSDEDTAKDTAENTAEDIIEGIAEEK